MVAMPWLTVSQFRRSKLVIYVANGGVAISHGLDVNQNGVLDADEIEETETVCHGVSADSNPVITVRSHLLKA